MKVFQRMDARVNLFTTFLRVAFGVVAIMTTDVTAQSTASVAPSSFPFLPSSRSAPQQVAALSALDVLPPPPTVTSSKTGQVVTPTARQPDISGPAFFRSQPRPHSPGSWPAQHVASQSTLYNSNLPSNTHRPAASGASTRTVFEAAKIIAWVGDQVILAGDLLGQVNQFIHKNLETLPAAADEGNGRENDPRPDKHIAPGKKLALFRWPFEHPARLRFGDPAAGT